MKRHILGPHGLFWTTYVCRVSDRRPGNEELTSSSDSSCSSKAFRFPLPCDDAFPGKTDPLTDFEDSMSIQVLSWNFKRNSDDSPKPIFSSFRPMAVEETKALKPGFISGNLYYET